MKRRHFVYQGKTQDEEMVVYYLEDEETGKKQYYVLEAIPKEFQVNKNGIEKAQRIVNKYNKENNKHLEITSLTDRGNRVHWFVSEPKSMIASQLEAMKFEVKVRREQKAIDANNKQNEQKEIKSKRIQFKKPENMKGVATKACAIGLSVLLLFGAAGLIKDSVQSAGIDDLPSGSAYSETFKPDGGYNEILPGTNMAPETTAPTTTTTPETNIQPEEEQHIDLETFQYRTFESYKGDTMIHPVDAYKIVDACYELFTEAINKYNEGVSEKNKLPVPDFDTMHMIARYFREGGCMLEVDLQKGEDIKEASDYHEDYRGPFQMGAAAIAEANEIAKKIFGEEIIKTEEDIYNVKKQCIASFCLNVKYHKYLIHYGVEDEDIRSNYYSGCYLYGAEGCAENNKQDSSYALRIEQYAKYFNENLIGVKDMTPEEAWKLYDSAWKLPTASVNTQGVEMGQ